MLSFSKIELSDKERAAACLAANTARVNERSFASLYMWSGRYEYEICVQSGMLFVRSSVVDGRRIFLAPVGTGDFAQAVAEIHAESLRQGEPYSIYCVTADEAEMLRQRYPDRFAIEADRDNFDYIYNSSDLAELPGKKYRNKRGHVSKFLRNYDGCWEYHAIDPEKDAQKLFELQQQWQRNKGEMSEDYLHEFRAIERGLLHYRELGLRGGIIEVDGRVVAFTFGVPLTADTFDVLIEKADIEYKGACQMINQAFAQRECGEFAFVSREEDMGIEGLRRAKESYYPQMFTEKYIVTPKKQGEPL